MDPMGIPKFTEKLPGIKRPFPHFEKTHTLLQRGCQLTFVLPILFQFATKMFQNVLLLEVIWSDEKIGYIKKLNNEL